MKKYIIILLFPLLSILSFGCSADQVSDEPDFRNASWGMTQEQVKETESSPPTEELPNVITYVSEFEGMPAVIGYLFDDGKLTRAGYVMTESYDEPGMYVNDFNKLRDLHTTKYGTPAYDTLNWKEGAESDINTYDYPKAACDGELQYMAGWDTRGSLVKLMLHGRDGKCELGVMYESKQYYLKPVMIEKGGE